METEFGSFWMLANFSLSPLALHFLILIPCFVRGRKKIISDETEAETDDETEAEHELFHFQN